MFREFCDRICDRFRQIRRECGPVRGGFTILRDKIGPCAREKAARLGSKIKHLCKKRGTAILEVALCLPVLLYLIFFMIEVIRVGVYQVAVDNMALKLAFEYSGLKSSTNFERVIEEAKPPLFKSMNNIHCRIYVFQNLDALFASETVSEDPQWMGSSLVSIRYPDGTISETTSGCAFIVTVSFDFPFSSPLIRRMFGGGKNYGDNFLLWSRAVNVCS